MTTYFHFRQDQRHPGDVINPSMRSILNGYLHSGNFNPWRLACEMALEEHRLAVAPNAIGRMDSNFVFLSEDDALRQVFRMGGSKFLYEVALVNPAAPTFQADFDLISKFFTMDNQPFLSKARTFAAQYWKGVIKGTPELLTTSPLKIVRIIRTFA